MSLELHVSNREYGEILEIVDACTVLDGGGSKVNDGQLYRTMRNVFGSRIHQFASYRIVVHPEVPDDCRLQLVVDLDDPKDQRDLLIALGHAACHAIEQRQNRALTS